MPKTQIEILTKPIYTTHIPVRITDVQSGIHVSFDKYAALLYEAKVSFFRNHGLNALDIDGATIMMINLNIEYKSQAQYGDILIFEISQGEITQATYEFIYLIKNLATDKEIARAKTTTAFYDYQQSKIVKLPTPFLALLKSLI